MFIVPPLQQPPPIPAPWLPFDHLLPPYAITLPPVILIVVSTPCISDRAPLPIPAPVWPPPSAYAVIFPPFIVILPPEPLYPPPKPAPTALLGISLLVSCLRPPKVVIIPPLIIIFPPSPL